MKRIGELGARLNRKPPENWPNYESDEEIDPGPEPSGHDVKEVQRPEPVSDDCHD